MIASSGGLNKEAMVLFIISLALLIDWIGQDLKS